MRKGHKMDAQSLVTLLLLGWGAVWGGFGIWVANQKGYGDGIGFTLGALFGPIGVIVLAILPPPLPEQKVQTPAAYQFKPRRMLGEVHEDSRSLRKVD